MANLTPVSRTDPGEVRIWRERRRGAPQRHAYSTQQEGLAKRRDRNRNTALSTYYKRKEKTAQLEAERDALEKENAALREILQTIESSLQDGPLQPGALNAHTAQ
ncbi:hypothetical protein WJX84_003640 [Apatococcus fuscideae]|uniref:BZIP domain-containing protein n=1 Tax=Apatococcus fuscideae TaxID=2026836 RepID=A0AAW1THD9_9CHLO